MPATDPQPERRDTPPVDSPAASLPPRARAVAEVTGPPPPLVAPEAPLLHVQTTEGQVAVVTQNVLIVTEGKKDEPLASRRLVQNAILVGVLTVAAPAALAAIVPYWWAGIAAAGAAVGGIVTVVKYFAERNLRTTAIRLLDSDGSTRNVLLLIAAAAVACAGLWLALPRPGAPYLRVFLMEREYLNVPGNVIRMTIEAPDGTKSYYDLEKGPGLDSMGWNFGRPDDRIAWLQKQAERKPLETLEDLAKQTLYTFTLPGNHQFYVNTWRNAATVPIDIPQGSKVDFSLGKRRGKTLVPGVGTIDCANETGTQALPLTIAKGGAQTAVLHVTE